MKYSLSDSLFHVSYFSVLYSYLCLNFPGMKQVCRMMVSVFFLLLISQLADAQCSICTKTASQLGEGPAKALNSAIIYLAGAPLAIMGYIGWRWWKKEKEVISHENKVNP